MSEFAARLGTVTLHPKRVRPVEGEWLAQLRERIEGWDELGDATETQPHPSGDGQVRGLRRSPIRPMALHLTIKSTRRYGLGSLSEAYGRLARMHRTTLYVVESDMAREIDVAVGEPRITEESAGFAVDTLPLVADDPLRHRSGYVDLPAGTSLLPNGGDRQAWPLVEVVGPVTLTITAPAGVLTVTVPSGTHTIDNRNGVVWTSSGTQLAPSAVSGPWAYVRPGGSQWTVSHPVRVRRWEAWS